MKKIIIFALAAAMLMGIGTKASAQVSAEAGYLNQALRISYSDALNRTSSLNGTYAGLFYDINEGEGLSVRTGLYYAFLTGRAEVVQGNLWGRLYEHSLNLPFQIGYSVGFNNGNRGFIYAGPTFTYGLASSVNAGVLDILQIKLSNNYKHDYLNRFDVKFGAGLGYELNEMIRINVGYNFGIVNQIGDGLKGKDENGNAVDGKLKLHRNTLNIGVAYLF